MTSKCKIGVQLLSFALDKTTNTKQLCILGQYIFGNAGHEEMIDILPMRGREGGEGRSNKGQRHPENCDELCKVRKIQLDNLCLHAQIADHARCTNTGDSFSCSDKSNCSLLNFHCSMHQEALWNLVELNLEV